MDSLKLDRFRKLLNRQNTSITLGDSQQQSAAHNSGCEQQSQHHHQVESNASKTTTAPSHGNFAFNANVTAAQASYSAITSNLPEYLTRDNPKPAHYIARRLFCDFTELAHKKIDIVIALKHDGQAPAAASGLLVSGTLTSNFATTGTATTTGTQSASLASSQYHQSQNMKETGHNQGRSLSASIFKTLQRDEDLIYDQILEALGVASEYCLPSLLKYLLLWYFQQLDAYSERSTSPQPVASEDLPTLSSSKCQSVDNHQYHRHQQDDLNTNKSLYQSTEISSLPSDQQQQQQQSTSTLTCDPNQLAAECGCISPCNNESHSFTSSTANQAHRSPTPASFDTTTNQISITSTLPLDYQSPAPQTTTMTTIIQKIDSGESKAQQEQEKDKASTANTSASTATNTSLNSTSLDDSTNLIKRTEIVNLRAALVEYAFCQAIIEIFSKLYLYPGYDDLIGQVEQIAYQHFKYIDEQELSGLTLSDSKRLGEKFAEVIGALAQTRFRSIKTRFSNELADLKIKEPTTRNIQSVCSLLAGMRSFRIKMAPIEEFETSFQFLQELADYFVEVRHKSIKHALAELFVEILLPLASMVKNEVKIPCLKNFVETLWAPTLDMCARKKHSATLFPLVTCLLCVSQRTIFLQNWGSFLNMCLSNLKNRDTKMCRIALESLYRLIWIYMIRIKGESNNVTQTRLNTIVDSLFPRGSRQIVPRDTPLVIFVDIIQFIAQERLDFAMRHIIFDLLSVDRSIKIIMAPERMNIGLQAFLVIADNLQQKEGDPAMPISIGSASAQQLAQIMHSTQAPSSLSSNPSSNNNNNNNNNNNTTTTTIGSHAHQYETSGAGTYGARRAHKTLNDETAKSIGLYPYYNHIQKSFNEILKALDTQFGRPLMLTALQTIGGGGGVSSHKDPPDSDMLISGDRRLRVELFKTCIAAIPRLMPDGMSKSDLVDLLARMTIHLDEEMRRFAFESLQKLVIEFQDWRLDAIEGFTLFLANQIDESLRNLVDNALRMLLQLLISWHSIITSTGSNSASSSTLSPDGNNNNNNNLNACGGSSPSLTKSYSIVTIQTGYETISSRNSGTGGQIVARKNRALAEMRLIQSELSNTRFDRLVNVIQKVEGASLVMLCSCHSTTRKLASLLLRECRAILRCYSSWTCMEQFGFRSPIDVDIDNYGSGGCGGAGPEEEFSVASMKGSLSADNLSRITTNSINNVGGIGGLAHSSMTSINTQAAMLSTSVSKMCLGSGGGTCTGYFSPFGSGGSAMGNNNTGVNKQAHDLYDEDIENNLTNGYSNEENNSSNVIFWIAVMMLESNKESEYVFALRLLRKILPTLPFEQEDFLNELNRNLKQMQWENCAGIHSFVLRGCSSAQTYDLCISLLDHMTPILRHTICTGFNEKKMRDLSCSPSLSSSCGSNKQKSLNCGAIEETLPYHVLVLSTYLLSTYEDPTPFSLNIARRLALCCEENSTKLENLSAVMTLYSRRSFSKDAFQWVKCVAKYLHDACPQVLPKTIPLLLDLLSNGPQQIQRLILPMLYCILTYTDIHQHQQQQQQQETDFNNQILMRLYNKCLGSRHLWRDAKHIFRLIISKSSSLANKSISNAGGGGGELPGRTMDFSLEIESVPIISKTRLAELGVLPNCSAVGLQATTTNITATSAQQQQITILDDSQVS